MDKALSANQAWRQSGTTLSFADWISREKEKGVFIKNDTLSSIVDESKKDIGVKSADLSEKPSGKILGIPKPVIVISAAVIIIAIGIKYYKK